MVEGSKKNGFGRSGLYFWDELPGRLPLVGKSSGPWAVRVAKKSARAISTGEAILSHLNLDLLHHKPLLCSSS